MIWGSTSEFILAMIRAGWPASACAISRSISAHNRLDRWPGATISLFQSLLCE